MNSFVICVPPNLFQASGSLVSEAGAFCSESRDGSAVAFYSDPELSKIMQVRLRERRSLSAFSKGKINTRYISALKYE